MVMLLFMADLYIALIILEGTLFKGYYVLKILFRSAQGYVYGVRRICATRH